MKIKAKDGWSESDVLALPSGEHDYLERKAGALLKDKDFDKDMAKAVSALANSGGGYLIFGQKDDGSFDGLPEKQGRTPIREWLEQKLPLLVVYPLQDFRIYKVEPDIASVIPINSVVVVIEISDSSLAPHQSEKDKLYYYRVGGHSKPAPHFYLETLRGRSKFPNSQVVEVWFETVINPLLAELSNQHKNLMDRRWFYDHESSTVKRITLLNTDVTEFSVSGNQDQFFEIYPQIKDAFDQREKSFVVFQDNIRELYNLIRESDAFYFQFKKCTTANSYQEVRNNINDEYKKTLSDEKLRQSFFSGNDENFLNCLAEYTINNVSKLFNNTIEPFWETHKEKFLGLRLSTEVGICENRIKTSAKKLLDDSISLANLLEETRKLLSQQHGVPYYKSDSGSRSNIFKSIL